MVQNRYRSTRGPLVDAYGRQVILMTAPPPYHGAGTGRRFAGMLVSGMSGTSAVVRNATTLRNRSHDLLRNNPWAWNGVDSFVSNAVGTGIKPQCQAPDPQFRAAAHALWTDWTDEADSEHVTDLYGLQSLVTHTLVESGEAFVRLRPRRLADGLSVPLQLQVLEPDHVPLTKFERLPNGNRIRAGIEFDGLGRRVAYWMSREHPGDMGAEGTADTQLVQVPADSVLHIFPITKQRAGQIRGEPWLARTLVRLKEIDEYDDAEIVRKKTAALFTAFVTSPDDQAPGLLGAGTPDSLGVAEATLEPGTMQFLQPGEHLEFANPPDVGANFQPFVNYQLRGIAAGLGITFEQLTGDLSGTNYSSIRAGLLEFRRRLLALVHQVLVFQFCRPVWQRFVREAIFSGALVAPDFLQQPRPWLRARWVTQGWPWVDPLKEVNAHAQSMLLGLVPRSELISERGEDAEAVDAQFAEDQARQAALGLMFTSTARRANDRTPESPARD